MSTNNTIKVIAVEDDCLKETKYTLFVNGLYYTSNISRQLVKQYIKKFVSQGYIRL